MTCGEFLERYFEIAVVIQRIDHEMREGPIALPHGREHQLIAQVRLKARFRLAPVGAIVFDIP